MANPEHLEILSQGIAAWNKWRENSKRPDLRKANLEGMNLEGANLLITNLDKANLREARLYGADLGWTDLGGAYLFGADLRKARLCGAKLSEADFLEEDDLANLKGMDDIKGANLEFANLEEADLGWADLEKANLHRANLRNANLSGANLVKTDLSNTNITGVSLYGTARDDWKIDGIKCNYVYWDKERKIRTPRNRDFHIGEFEELHKSLPTFDYYFEHGFTPIDAVVMDQVVTAINEKHPEFELKLDSFHSRGRPHAKFTVLHKESIEEVRKQIGKKYEQEIKFLEGRLDYANEMVMRLMTELKKPHIQIGDNINIQGQNVSFAKDQGKAEIDKAE